MSESSLTVYTKENCSYCMLAKSFLENNDIPFEMVDIGVNAESRDFILNEGHRSVPQIYRGDQLFVEGGYKALIDLGAEKIKLKLSSTTQEEVNTSGEVASSGKKGFLRG